MNLINRNISSKTAVKYSLLFNLFCNLVMFIRALLGSAKKDWGYSEYLLDYSEGFIRRGITGTLVLFAHRIFALDPYYFLVLSIEIIILIIIFVYYYLVKSSNLKASSIIFLSVNPLLLNAPFLSVTMLRKDWLILLGLFAHAFATRLILTNRIKSYHYLVFLFVLTFYSQIVILSHEINFLFLGIHFILFKNVSHNLNLREIKIAKLSLIMLFFSQFVWLLILSSNTGNVAQVQKIVENISKNYEIGNVNAILAFGDSIEIISKRVTEFDIFFHNLKLYAVWFILGPMTVLYLLKRRYLRTHILSLIPVLPIFLLFILVGGDWGRWLILITYCVFIVMISDWQNIYYIPEIKLIPTLKQRKKILAKLSIIFLFSLGLMFRVPVGNPSSFFDVWSGVAEIVFRLLT